MKLQVPFYRPRLGSAEIEEVVSTLQSGWLTTGPRVKRFEEDFGAAVRAPHAIAMNSCTAALHMAIRALGIKPGEGVLVPTLTFAATAEVIRYEGAYPVLVDSEPVTLNMDLADAERKVEALQHGQLAGIPANTKIVGVIPVHVGGYMMDVDEIKRFAERHSLWIVEDAAHAFPAAWRPSPESVWQRCGEGTATVSCFSFYANKTITTGEGGMAVTHDPELAARMRLLSLHGLSRDAWDRYSAGGSWDYRILEPGYKYNLTDIAAAIGIHQLARAEAMRATREKIAHELRDRLSHVEEIELPLSADDRIHSWHLFPIRVRLDALTAGRDRVIEELRQEGISCSVHWRPLHLHPYYENTFGWRDEHLPVASDQWRRLISLPLFSDMRTQEIDAVVDAVGAVCRRLSRTHEYRLA